MVLCMVMGLSTINTFAQQLEEVRGVRTRVVKYELSDDEKYYKQDSLHGFEFKNENNYTVWCEVELVTPGFKKFNFKYVEGGIVDKKSFTLKPEESYIWKCGPKMLDDIGYNYLDCIDDFYVKYTAYKAK